MDLTIRNKTYDPIFVNPLETAGKLTSIKWIPKGYKPYFGFGKQEPWIERFERRGWTVQDDVKVKWGCCYGLVCENEGFVYDNETSHFIISKEEELKSND